MVNVMLTVCIIIFANTVVVTAVIILYWLNYAQNLT